MVIRLPILKTDKNFGLLIFAMSTNLKTSIKKIIKYEIGFGFYVRLVYHIYRLIDLKQWYVKQFKSAYFYFIKNKL